MVWIYGYGFPRCYRGGPMFYADTVGVKHVYDTMSRLHDEHGDWLEPAPLLKQLAESGKGFGDFVGSADAEPHAAPLPLPNHPEGTTRG